MSFNERKVVIKRFAIFAIGIFLNYSGYLVLLGLQSSINIEDGVGAASITATFATSSVFGILCTPIIIRKLGPQACLLFCEFTILVYITANAYPMSYILIPAGVFTGMGEATMWPVMGLFVVHYARCYARHGEESTDSYITQFFGIFYAVFQFSGVFGNLLSYAILFGGNSPPQLEFNSTDNTSSVAPTVSKDLSICGINDCQDPNITEANEDRYEPASMTLIYILVGVAAAMVLLAMSIHKFVTKPIDISLEIQDELSEKKEVKEQSNLTFIISTVKATILHFISPSQLLLIPFALYSGLSTSFLLTELPRAFGSCMIGVEKVGLLAALGGSADVIMSFLSLKMTSLLGRSIPIAFGYILNVAGYLLCTLWLPTESSLWVVYIIFLLFGLIDGIWQPLINEIHAASFPENRDIALTVWNLLTLLGMTWQTAWSTSVCVYLKIFIQCGFLTFSVICYIIQRKFYGNKIDTTEENLKQSYKTKL